MRKMIFGLIFGVMLVSCIPIVFAQSALLDIYDNSDILVLVKTRSGNLLIEFFPDDAPNRVGVGRFWGTGAPPPVEK